VPNLSPPALPSMCYAIRLRFSCRHLFRHLIQKCPTASAMGHGCLGGLDPGVSGGPNEGEIGFLILDTLSIRHLCRLCCTRNAYRKVWTFIEQAQKSDECVPVPEDVAKLAKMLDINIEEMIRLGEVGDAKILGTVEHWRTRMFRERAEREAAMRFAALVRRRPDEPSNDSAIAGPSNTQNESSHDAETTAQSDTQNQKEENPQPIALLALPFIDLSAPILPLPSYTWQGLTPLEELQREMAGCEEIGNIKMQRHLFDPLVRRTQSQDPLGYNLEKGWERWPSFDYPPPFPYHRALCTLQKMPGEEDREFVTYSNDWPFTWLMTCLQPKWNGKKRK